MELELVCIKEWAKTSLYMCKRFTYIIHKTWSPKILEDAFLMRLICQNKRILKTNKLSAGIKQMYY